MNSNIKPFLKWAGGKSQLLDEIIQELPMNIKKIEKYVEPFVGAGAVFLYFLENDYFEEYIINDINSKLINLYMVIRDNPQDLIKEMQKLKTKYLNAEYEEKEKLFYEIRDNFNKSDCKDIKLAAYFIFLNKTCFNGLYRENSKGNFNVPFGKYKNPSFFDELQIMEISRLLSLKNENDEFKVKILNKSFSELEEYIDNNTFVYCDPPYRPVTVGGFTSYNKSNFNDEAQILLRDFYKVIDAKGAKGMLSNSDPKNLDEKDNFFDDLYSDFSIKRVYAKRNINSVGSGRGKITELLITNYDEGNGLMKISYEKNDETFNYLLSTLKDSIKGWDYFVNWNKVNTNIKNIEIQLNLMNYLIGKENIYDEVIYLIKQYPHIISVIPILVACREKNFEVITSDETNMVTSKKYIFNDYENLDDKKIHDIVDFMSKTQILELFSNKTIKNIVDYVFGVEVGLDSNGRKNRSGHAMEDIVEKFIAKKCKETGFTYMKEATPSIIKREWGYDVTVDKSARRFDFVINTGSKLYLIETNYYSGGGSKLKATAGEYKTLYDIATKDGHEFVWITDGKGWLTARRPLEETFYHNKYIINLTMLEQGILNEIIKD